MPNNTLKGHFRGTALRQEYGEVGGYKNVFVNLVGNHDDMVYSHFGGKIMNPPKGRAKMWAGDLLEYRPKLMTPTSDRLDPEIYILRTFKVADAVSNTTTVYIEQLDDKGEPFRHKPFVGDCLMVAPSVIGGEGTAVKVVSVTSTTVTISSKPVKVWQLTISAALTITKGAILVEADNFTEGTSATKAMLVKNINGVFDCDTDFDGEENIGDVGVTRDVTTGEITSVTDSDFYKSRYQYTPALGGMMWISKMSPIPQCVLDLNISNYPNIYHVNWALNGKKINAGVEAAADVKSEYFMHGAADPTTATAAPVGAVYISDTDGGIFHCVAIDNSGDTPSYTWSEVTVS